MIHIKIEYLHNVAAAFTKWSHCCKFECPKDLLMLISYRLELSVLFNENMDELDNVSDWLKTTGFGACGKLIN